MFFKIGALKNFHLCWSLFLKVGELSPATLLTRDSNTGVSCEYCEILKNSFFIGQLGWLLLVFCV